MNLHLLLADDDIDDCDFFREAIDEIGELTLSVLNDGVELMNFLLAEPINHPNLIFLDLNMPKKSGMECMVEIKAINELKNIPIIIYSTSLDRTVVNQLYDMGAHHYIQKPGEFANIKKVVEKAISLFTDANLQLRSKDKFIIQP
ncbi:response regulator [Winogradskyella pacifica]|jgi:response regulator RpfG family c-di-GMP phosphodiesterase|uniref:Response regulator receiver domain-containing protein n=1 Tax=Winogradskyella pacifica TaxID=664642 RepID=A0A3D9MZJ0_9FLAO|nr:response regulator [Winogradskyella pacifica]REE25765.1 response regulator receiver domain-containing protein [Winogradskyella pacifica]